jgi:hypothetical protein
MKLLLLSIAALLAVACSAPAPTQAPGASQLPAQPLPSNITGIPGPGDESELVTPQSEAGTWEVGQPQQLTLGHCGLGSPLDFDGSLWNPTGGHNGNGQAPSQEQINDVINSTPVTIMLISPLAAVMTTQNGGVVYLDRHEGPRAYFPCD